MTILVSNKRKIGIQLDSQPQWNSIETTIILASKNNHRSSNTPIHHSAISSEKKKYEMRLYTL